MQIEKHYKINGNDPLRNLRICSNYIVTSNEKMKL